MIKFSRVFCVIVSLIFVNCEHKDHYISKKYSLNDKFEEIIKIEEENLLTENMELVLTGHYDGVGELFIISRPYPNKNDPPDSFYHRITIAHEINITISHTFYEQEWLLRFIPEKDNTEGTLFVKLRVF
jgi:hypothetical protein